MTLPTICDTNNFRTLAEFGGENGGESVPGCRQNGVWSADTTGEPLWRARRSLKTSSRSKKTRSSTFQPMLAGSHSPGARNQPFTLRVC